MVRKLCSAAALCVLLAAASCSGVEIGGQPAPARPASQAPATDRTVASTATPRAANDASAARPRTGDISASARVVPLRSAQLGYPTTGRVQAVTVEEGQRVEAGALLVSLDQAASEAGVAQAQAALARARAGLADLKDGPRSEELTAAQAAVDAAQAGLASVQEAARAEDVAAAEAVLAAARAALRKAQEGPDAAAVTAARADLANAEAAVRQAQAAYDQIKGNPDAGQYPQALQLEQATNALQAAKARYNQVSEGPSAADLASAQAAVEQAAAGLAKVKAGARPGDVALAQADVRRAQAQYDLLKAGSRPEGVAAAEAEVAQAQAVLQRAQADLASTELRAPFTGVVTSVKVSPGETVSPGQPVVTVADASRWQIETTDLSERDVAGVSVGEAVTVRVDALSAQLTGRVAKIAPQANVVAGDVVYTVLIDIERQPEGLRWGMTGQVDIAR